MGQLGLQENVDYVVYESYDDFIGRVPDENRKGLLDSTEVILMDQILPGPVGLFPDGDQVIPFLRDLGYQGPIIGISTYEGEPTNATEWFDGGIFSAYALAGREIEGLAQFRELMINRLELKENGEDFTERLR